MTLADRLFAPTNARILGVAHLVELGRGRPCGRQVRLPAGQNRRHGRQYTKCDSRGGDDQSLHRISLPHECSLTA